MDISDVALLVQFGVLSSLTVWLQRAGRAGQSPLIQACAILVVERSVLMHTGNKNKDPSNSMDMVLILGVCAPLIVLLDAFLVITSAVSLYG